MIENNKGLYVIPKSSDRGGASILYTSESGSTEWLLDILTGYEVSNLNSELFNVYLEGALVEALVVTGSTSTGIVTTIIRTDMLGGLGPIVANSTEDSVAVAYSPYEVGYAQSLLTRTEVSLNVNLDNELELQIRAYFSCPPVSPAVEDTLHVVGYAWADFFNTSLSLEYNRQVTWGTAGDLSDIPDTEKVVIVQTMHKKISYGGASYSYPLPVVITDVSAYLVVTPYNKFGYLFEGSTVELSTSEDSYQTRFFDGTDSVVTRDLMSAAVSTFITTDGILALELPGDGNPRMSFIRIEPDIPTLLPISGNPELNAYFDDLAIITSGRIGITAITAEEIEEGVPRLIATIGDQKYLRVNHTIIEVNTKAKNPQIITAATFGRDAFSPVTFAVNEFGGLLEIKEGGIFIHPEIANADTGMEDESLETSGVERIAYTTKQDYTKVYLDPEAVSAEHPILMGTRLDSNTEEVFSSTIADEITGEYSSNFGYSFLTTDKQTVLTYGTRRESSGQLLSTPGISGVLVSGADFTTHGIRRTILLCTEETTSYFYCFMYEGETAKLVQSLTVDNQIFRGNISSIQDGNGDTLIAQTSAGVFLAEVASFGVVINGVNTFTKVLDSTTDDELEDNNIYTSEAYTHPSLGKVLCVASGDKLTTYRYFKKSLSSIETASDVAMPVTGLQSVVKGSEVTLIAWGTNGGSVRLRSYNAARPWAPMLSLEKTFGENTKISASKFAVAVTEEAQVSVYQANRTLSAAGVFASTSLITSIFGEHVLTISASSTSRYLVEGRRWWAGLVPEVCYDSMSLDYKVPIYSVDYEDDPVFYDRTVIERDTIYQEPVTVAYRATSARRARKVVSNRRIAFKRGTAIGGGLNMLGTTENTRKLLRNSVLWCLEVDPDTLVGDVNLTEEEGYLPSPKVSPLTNDILSMEGLPACVNRDQIGRILETIPESGIFIEPKYLPGVMEQGVFFENKIVPVYVREQTGASQLRVEFGEYRDPGSADTTAYTTPGLSDTWTEVGLVSADGASAYKFWHALWEQNKETGVYLSQLLDLREVAVGPASFNEANNSLSDITEKVNPAKLLITHLLADSVITVIRVKERAGATADMLIHEAKEDLDRIPWLQVNKTLPANSKCVTVYVVESNNPADSKTVTPDLYNG